MNIHRSRTEKLLTIIEEVMKFFEGRYPADYKAWVADILALRAASTPSYKARGEDVYVSCKVPSVPFLAVKHVAKCQRIEPEFGQSMDDIALFTRVCKALDAHVPVKKGCSLVLPPGFHQSIYGGKDADQTATGEADRPAKGRAGNEA